MTIAALKWAFDQDLRPSHKKFLLVCLADNADEEGRAYPSIAHLMLKSCQDRKTIIKVMDELEREGWIEDTGERKGSTKQVKVYRIIGFKPGINHYVFKLVHPKTGEFYIGTRSCGGDPEGDAFAAAGIWPQAMERQGVALAKEILGTFLSREEAEAMEKRIIRDNQANQKLINKKHKVKQRVPYTEPFKGSRPSVQRVPSIPENGGVRVPPTGHGTPIITPIITPKEKGGFQYGKRVEIKDVEIAMSCELFSEVKDICLRGGFDIYYMLGDYAQHISQYGWPRQIKSALPPWASTWVKNRKAGAAPRRRIEQYEG